MYIRRDPGDLTVSHRLHAIKAVVLGQTASFREQERYLKRERMSALTVSWVVYVYTIQSNFKELHKGVFRTAAVQLYY